ncbi:VOC family protein [Nocardia araoensis]|uniref:VOC family protein n=1 Tax=Nocardia araoensis TaxID=228600 RepID=UPI0002DD9AAE|nr:glyoxalase/bleomycin resistance/dioxygenase family protein [Nocardia araoensis]
MTIQRIGPAYPTEDLPAAVALLTAVLATEPTVVDGDRWAQFDSNGVRVMLAGTDRADDSPFLAIKVDDLDAALNRLRSKGFDAAQPVVGPHERRAALRPTPGSAWHIALYEPIGSGANPADRPGTPR